MAHIDSPRTDLVPAVKALLTDSVDYAGTFPPASLSLDEAIRNYAAYRQQDDAWMLGRFVCPAVRLDELRRYEEIFAASPPFRVSVLAGEGDRTETFLATLAQHVDHMAVFASELKDAVRIESVEMRLPGAVLSTDVISIRHFVDDLAAALQVDALQKVDIFLELPLDENVRQILPMVTGALHAFNREHTDVDDGAAGLKLRTGGTDADAVPSSASVALAIATCRASDVRFKATAGLHHPLRHHYPGQDAETYGFLNLFVAAVLASAADIGEAQIADVLSEASADSFSFSDDGLAWSGRHAGIEAIERARRRLVVSFGSCSFEEPTGDLRTLGLI